MVIKKENVEHATALIQIKTNLQGIYLGKLVIYIRNFEAHTEIWKERSNWSTEAVLNKSYLMVILSRCSV